MGTHGLRHRSSAYFPDRYPRILRFRKPLGYDEFGNYVGPELDDDSDGGSGEDADEVRAVDIF